MIKIQHANPYYACGELARTSGDAIETELIPRWKSSFAGFGRAGAVYLIEDRCVVGVARGADFLSRTLSGAFVACPDPVAFHAHMTGIV
jgi:hypothetical protein